ncbi:MAG: type I-E CRISPR-associated protein Cse1/CasA [Desulfobaccales bacterium]
MTPYFNLVDEPWIPCLMPDNRLQEFGLLEVLVRAPEIREIFHSSPLVVTAVHRLLLAILHRNFGPESLAAWKELWERRSFDAQALQEYFDRWRERFFLFHPERPFYQVPRMEDARVHPVQLLALEAAAGNNATLFDHHFSEHPATFRPAQAACYLVARQAYSIGLGKSHPFYFSDSPLIRGYTVLVLGKNLFQTLALNLLPVHQDRPIPRIDEDLPSWELPSLPEPDPRGNLITGYISYLTWQSRRIHLIAEGNSPVVRFCQIQQNWKLPEPTPLDPFKSYRRLEKEGLVPRGLSPERAVWRDCHALLELQGRPEVLASLAQKKAILRDRKDCQFSITGAATEGGKAAQLILWRYERLPLPLDYLEDENLLGELRNALEVCERAHDCLNQHMRNLAALVLAPPVGGQKRQADPQEVARLVQSWAPGRRYWARLEAPFRHLMAELPADQVENEEGEVVYGTRLLPEWRRTVYKAARQSFQEVAKSLENSLRSLKALAQVEGRFFAALKKELLPEEQT